MLTTPFDLLTTNVMLEAESAEEEVIEKLEEKEELEQEREAAVDRRRSSPSGTDSPAHTPSARGTGTTTIANANRGTGGFASNPSPVDDAAPKGLATEIVQIFGQTLQDILKQGGPAALFTGAVPRLLFFAPAGMIFFATYEGVFEILAVLEKNSA